MGHPEYDRMTLDSEYKRDMGRGLNPQIPENYYPDDDPENKPVLTWRSHAKMCIRDRYGTAYKTMIFPRLAKEVVHCL